MAIPAVDPERKRTLAQYRVQINGSNAPKELDQAIVKVTIDERLHVPTMFEIELRVDPRQPKWIDEPAIGEGKEIEILVGYADQEKSICIGKVTSLEVDLDEQMPTLVVRGYDLSFALHRDVKSRSFVKQTDGDIAKKIAGEAGGLTPKIDATTEVHDYVLQHAQTNYDFLLDRARRIGYELRVVGKELQFRKPAPEGSPVDLEWGVSLKAFHPRLSVAEQVDEVVVRSWDVQNKQVLVGTASNGQTAPKVGETRAAGSVANGVWGSAKHTVVDAPTATLEEATAMAQAMLDDFTSSFIEATGESKGDPKLRVGASINVKGVGKRFGGTYYLTAVRHTLSKQHGHQVFFTAGTQRPTTVSSLLMTKPPEALAPHVAVGIVTNNQDPLDLARVKVKFPTLFDEDESYWARLSMPMAGKERGFLTIPEVNDEVLVAFEHGDPTRPFILGGLWNGQDVPPKGTADLVAGGVVNQRIWRSRNGHLFLFDDTDGAEAIRIIDKTGNNHITITSSDNKLVVELDGDVEITSKTGQIKVTAQKDISLESQSGKIKLKAVTAELEATQAATMKTGTSFDLQAGTSFAAKATTSAEINGSVSAKLEGGIANVQGQSATNIKGGVVNIN
ncbi:MAG TPA: VgrG-related protein [Thermomicrobiales bacterium]|nr:VgrG-related protein [Thermomicrobiales bacterium]